MSAHQEIAEQRDAVSPGDLKFTQLVKGWSGSGFEESFRMIEGGFIPENNVASIRFETIDTVGGRRMGRYGSITLSEADAIKFALAIAPQLANALRPFAEYAKTFGFRPGEQGLCAMEMCISEFLDAQAVFAAAGAV